MMKHFCLTLTLLIASLSPMLAQNRPQQRPQRPQIDRQEWMAQLKQYRHTFLAKELKLTDEQQEQFFPIYDEMNDALERVFHDARATEQRIEKAGMSATDEMYSQAADAMFKIRSREAAIEKKYYPRFKAILSSRQLFELKRAERAFTNSLMREHSNARAGMRR